MFGLFCDFRIDTISQLDSIVLCLQRDDTIMAQVKVLFDTAIEHMPNMKNSLDSNSGIVESKKFEAAIV